MAGVLFKAQIGEISRRKSLLRGKLEDYSRRLLREHEPKRVENAWQPEEYRQTDVDPEVQTEFLLVQEHGQRLQKSCCFEGQTVRNCSFASGSACNVTCLP